MLLTEDNETNRVSALCIPRRFNGDVDVMENGEQALKRCLEKRYDVIFMDCRMPILDGYEAARIIRQRDRDTNPVTIVAMTANAMMGDREKCLAAGMDDYIAKPIDLQNSNAVLRRYCLPTNPPAVPADAGEPEGPATAKAAQTSLRISDADGESVDVLALELDSLPILDYTELLNRIDQDEQFAIRLLTGFLKVFPQETTDLLAAIESGNPDAVAFAAHRLKGEARNLSANRLQVLLQRVEDRGRSGNLSGIGFFIDPIKKHCADLTDYIKNQGWKCPADG